MDYLAELPISNDALGLIIAGLIFIVTVVLIAKKLISFLITVVLLFFAIASGMAIAHNDLVREYFSKEKIPQSENDENFLIPLKDEAVQLLHRLADLVHNQGKAVKTHLKEQLEEGPYNQQGGSGQQRGPGQQGMRPDQQGMRPDQQGMRPDQQGMRPDQNRG